MFVFFFQWFLLVLICSYIGGGIERTDQIFEVVKQSLYAWKSEQGGDSTMLHFVEMKFLRKYLQYLRLKEYDVKKLEAMETL